MLPYKIEFFGGDALRQRTPTVAITDQNYEVGSWGNLPAAIDFTKADLHRLLVFGSFLANAPSQINSLEARIVFRAKFPQLWENFLVQSVALQLEVTEC